MAQLFIVDDKGITLNSQTLVESGLGNSIAVSSDVKTMYIASSALPYIRKYVNKSKTPEDSKTHEWTLDEESFKNPIGVSQYPSGLLLDGEHLLITLNESNNGNTTSKILKVNAVSGSQYVSAETGMYSSEIYSSTGEGLTAMVVHNNYLYVLNTGENNTGRSINKIALNSSDKHVGWVKDLDLSPIQLSIYENYLCVLTCDYLQPADKKVLLINLQDANIAHSYEIANSSSAHLGLSLVDSLLNIIDEKGVNLYSSDLSAAVPVLTSV